MRPIEFVYNVIDLFAPMSEIDRNELRQEATYDYIKVKNEVFDDKKQVKIEKAQMTWKHKLVKWSEHWTVRTLVAMMFLFAQRWVTDYINPPDDSEDEFFDE